MRPSSLRGSFSLGSWCHLVGTGGGTATALCSGLARRLVSEGFCLQTVEVTEEDDEEDVEVEVAVAARVPPPPPLPLRAASMDDLGEGSPASGEAAGRLTPAASALEVDGESLLVADGGGAEAMAADGREDDDDDDEVTVAVAGTL